MRKTLAILSVSLSCSSVAADQLNVPEQFPTIQQSIEAAEDGDIILVAPGTYYESINFLGKRIVLRSLEGAASTFINGSESDSSVVKFTNFEGLATTIDGFTITGGSGSPAAGVARGGGIFAESSSPTIRNCHIVGNSAGAGGGIAAWTASPWLFNCVIEDNIATDNGSAGGGGLHCVSSFPRLVNVEFLSNNAIGTAPAGAIALQDLSDAELINCLVVDNRGRHTGGIYCINSILKVRNSTFAHNTATNSSGGHAVKVIGQSSLGTILNSVFWENGQVGEGDEVEGTTATTTVLSSCVEGGWPGEGNLDVDPRFIDPDAGNYRLNLDSPLIDRGNNSFLSPEITMDLAMNPRFADPENEEITPNVDLGPFEVQPEPAPPCEGDIDGNSSVDLADLLTVISQWGSCGSSACDGDVDGDGFVALNDLLIIIGQWGDCPL